MTEGLDKLEIGVILNSPVLYSMNTVTLHYKFANLWPTGLQVFYGQEQSLELVTKNLNPEY